MRQAALRLVALIVLLSGAADYIAFDVTDPLAPMDAGRSSTISQRVIHRVSSTAIRDSDGADDKCIGCAAGFPVRPIRPGGVMVIASAPVLFLRHVPDAQLVRVNPPPRA